MKKLNLILFTCASSSLLVQAANTPMPAVMPKTAVTMPQPVAKAPMPKIMTPTPVATAKTGPVNSPITSAKSTTPTTASSTITQATTKLPIQINIKNTSNFGANLTGFTIIHKDAVGNKHSLSQTISNTKFKIYPASAKKLLPVAFNLKAVPGTFFVGTSAVFINNQQVSTIFKNEPWNSGMTDAIYITSTDGTTWNLDQAAMNKAYQKPTKATHFMPKSTAGKVTSITKAATVPVIQQESEQPKAMTLHPEAKNSKSAKAAAKAINTRTVQNPTNS